MAGSGRRAVNRTVRPLPKRLVQKRKNNNKNKSKLLSTISAYGDKLLDVGVTGEAVLVLIIIIGATLLSLNQLEKSALLKGAADKEFYSTEETRETDKDALLGLGHALPKLSHLVASVLEHPPLRTTILRRLNDKKTGLMVLHPMAEMFFRALPRSDSFYGLHVVGDTDGHMVAGKDCPIYAVMRAFQEALTDRFKDLMDHLLNTTGSIFDVLHRVFYSLREGRRTNLTHPTFHFVKLRSLSDAFFTCQGFTNANLLQSGPQRTFWVRYLKVTFRAYRDIKWSPMSKSSYCYHGTSLTAGALRAIRYTDDLQQAILAGLASSDEFTWAAGKYLWLKYRATKSIEDAQVTVQVALNAIASKWEDKQEVTAVMRKAFMKLTGSEAPSSAWFFQGMLRAITSGKPIKFDGFPVVNDLLAELKYPGSIAAADCFFFNLMKHVYIPMFLFLHGYIDEQGVDYLKLEDGLMK